MIRTLLISLVLACLSHANPTLNIRCLLATGDEMPKWHIVTEEGKFQPLTWPSNQPTQALEIAGVQELTLYAEDVDEGHKAVQTLVIPEGAEEVLLIATADGEEPKVSVVADNLKQATYKDWLVINLSELEVNLSYGKDKEPVNLQAEEAKIYTIEGTAGESDEVIAQAKVGDKMRKIYSTYWKASADQRALVIITSKDGRPKVKRITDFLP